MVVFLTLCGAILAAFGGLVMLGTLVAPGGTVLQEVAALVAVSGGLLLIGAAAILKALRQILARLHSGPG